MASHSINVSKRLHRDDEMKITMDRLCINTIRTLSIDAIQKANSGHPGTPMGFAPAIYILWKDFLNYDPHCPLWPNRDRFVFSVGHASMLLYSMIYLGQIAEIDKNGNLTGRAALSIEDLKTFRQLGSKATGHPEYGLTTGVETTTGPLGQGLAVSVGMAIAEKWMAKRYNKKGFDLFNHRIYAATGDGCLMEGISYEAAALAGHLGLDHLIWVYDRNKISIEGSIDLTFTENIGLRFQAAGWNVVEAGDINALEAVKEAIQQGCESRGKPTLVIVDSVIGYGSPRHAGHSSAHGSPLGEEEVKATKAIYDWPQDKNFYIPEGVLEYFAEHFGQRGHEKRVEWEKLFAAYYQEYPELARELEQIFNHELPQRLLDDLPMFSTSGSGLPTRDSSSVVMNHIAYKMPWFIGGSADVAPSTKTALTFKGAHAIQSPQWGGDFTGQNLHFGIREHAMGAICNGLASYGLRSFCSAYLTFSDYMKTPIRLAALMGLPSLFIFTHDSITVGEDGPTHQPIEHLMHYRMVPDLLVHRPADALEVRAAWKNIMHNKSRPSLLVLGRHSVPTFARENELIETNMERGAYIIRGIEENPTVILIATGSEVAVAIAACEELVKLKIKTRVVSMPCWEIFEEQDDAYKNEILPSHIECRVVIEAGSPHGWERYAGKHGRIMGLNQFGESGKVDDVLRHFGFTKEEIVKAVMEHM